MNGSLVWSSYVPQALFFGKDDIPGFLRHAIALLRTSYVPQALFFRKSVTHKWLWLYL